MMKKYFVSLFAMALATVSASADDALTMNSITLGAGKSGNLEILLDNTSPVQSLGMYIELPAGITVDASKVALNTSRAPEADDMIAANNIGQVCRVAMLGIGGKAVNGNNGVLYTIPVTVAEGTVDGEYDITLSNVELSTTSNTVINIPTASYKLTVMSAIPADVDGNGKVDHDDVKAVVGVICGGDAFKDKADVNNDSKVDINDVTKVIEAICN